MAIVAAIFGTTLALWVLWEGFETIVLPRRVTRRFQFTRLFYRRTWLPWARMVSSFVPARRQETWLSVFGPLSLLLLMSVWVGGLITGFALLHWSIGSALTAILDTCALIMASLQKACERQGELTFAMARHAVVDLSLVFRTKPREPKPERLSPEKLAELRALLAGNGLTLPEGEAIDRKLAELRQLYEPYVHALANYFRITIPPWIAAENWRDNWQVTMWEQPAGKNVAHERAKRGHF